MTPPNKKDALGKGIRTLLQNINDDLKTTDVQLKGTAGEAATGVIRIPVEEIEINPKQPRRDFDEQALKELSDSIKMHDIIQPVTVSMIAPHRYRLIAGERRWRATKMAGIKDIPAYIRQANDQQLLELALLENLQREDLNAMEIGLSYKRLMEELSYNQEQVAERMGKDRTTVANYIRLLKLPPDIQVAVRKGELSFGHARALINVDNIDQQLFVYNEIRNKGLSVRQTESLVRQLYKPAKHKKAAAKTLPSAYQKIEDNMASHFSTKVKLQHSKKGNGSITLEYYTLEQLNHILKQMGISAD